MVIASWALSQDLSYGHKPAALEVAIIVGSYPSCQGPNPFSLLLAVLASLYKHLEFWKVADVKSFDVAEAWLKEQLGGHDSEWLKQLEAAEKFVERSKPKQQTRERPAKFTGNKSGGGARQWQQPMQYPPYAYNAGYPAYPQGNNVAYGQQFGAPYGPQMPLSLNLLHLLPLLGTLLEPLSSRIIGRLRALAGPAACMVSGLGTQYAQ